MTIDRGSANPAAEVRIYQLDNGVVVADGGGWIPGIYDSEATARHAATLDIAVVQAVNDEVCHVQRQSRPITMDDLLRATL